MPLTAFAIRPTSRHRCGLWDNWDIPLTASSAPPGAAASPSEPVETARKSLIRSLSLNFSLNFSASSEMETNRGRIRPLE